MYSDLIWYPTRLKQVGEDQCIQLWAQRTATERERETRRTLRKLLRADEVEKSALRETLDALLNETQEAA